MQKAIQSEKAKESNRIRQQEFRKRKKAIGVTSVTYLVDAEAKAEMDALYKRLTSKDPIDTPHQLMDALYK